MPNDVTGSSAGGIQALLDIAPGTALGATGTVPFTATDIRMNAAQDTARRHLTRFLDHVLDDGGNARTDAAVKVALPAGDEQEEIIWITPFARRDGGFIGALAIDPQLATEHSAGEVSWILTVMH